MIVIAAFPGAGKSWLSKSDQDVGTIADLEPSPFKYGDDAPNWPENYLAAIDAAQEADIILIATFPEVVEVLLAKDWSVHIVYPDESQKDEYHRRYIERRNTAPVVKALTDGFWQNVQNLRQIAGGTHHVLDEGQYLADIIGRII